MSDSNKLKNLGSQKTKYEYDHPESDQLETFHYDNRLPDQLVGFQTDEFTSLCPKTGQPDFASIDILYMPQDLGVESKSLKLYLFRYRNHGSFHEDCINKIAMDLIEVLNPKYLRVIGDFTKRGGIAIKPVSEYAPEGRPQELVAQYDNYSWRR
ncbi:preQ(1) synthase [Polynucleobacter sp.]|uniref:preQ(1) synthase n=1 Tax=Polynucleobacter sp. TaxID=2029855 RepID=UPI003F6A1E3D